MQIAVHHFLISMSQSQAPPYKDSSTVIAGSIHSNICISWEDVEMASSKQAFSHLASFICQPLHPQTAHQWPLASSQPAHPTHRYTSASSHLSQQIQHPYICQPLHPHNQHSSEPELPHNQHSIEPERLHLSILAACTANTINSGLEQN